jgi:hypothetical protein
LGGRGGAGIASTQTDRLIRTGRKIDNPAVFGCATPNARAADAVAKSAPLRSTLLPLSAAAPQL